MACLLGLLQRRSWKWTRLRLFSGNGWPVHYHYKVSCRVILYEGSPAQRYVFVLINTIDNLVTYYM